MNKNPEHTYRVKQSADEWVVQVFYDTPTANGDCFEIRYFRNDALPTWLRDKIAFLQLMPDDGPFVDGYGKRIGDTYIVCGNDGAKAEDIGFLSWKSLGEDPVKNNHKATYDEYTGYFLALWANQITTPESGAFCWKKEKPYDV